MNLAEPLSLSSENLRSLPRSASLAASIAQAQAKISNLTQAEPNLAAMMTEYAQAEESYKTLSEKYDQAGVAENEFSKNGSLVPGWSRYATGPT